jgi:hypothetical protein
MRRRQTPRILAGWHRARRGGTILASLIFIAIIAICIVAMLELSISEARLTRQRIEREFVYYTAEAGVDQVVHYFNYPGDYTPDTDLFTKDPDSDCYYTSSTGLPPYTDNVFEDRVPSGGLTLIGLGTNDDLIVFTNEPVNTDERARVNSLRLTLPEAGDPPNSILVVSSTGINSRSVARTVRVVLSAEPAFPILIPAAVISHALAGSNGQFNVHWGEAWARADMDIANLNNITTTTDPWAIFRVVGFITKGTKFATGYGGGGGWSDAPLIPAESNYGQPWLGYDPIHTNLLQHVDPGTMEWPTLDYNQWKQAALTRGHYFSTDASGNLYYGTEETPDNLINSSEFFNIIDQTSDLSVDTGVPGDQTLPQPNIVFIDTVDGQPPNNPADPAASTNLCDINLAGGGGIFTRGVMYVAGSFHVGGAGSPPAVWIQDPDKVIDPSTGTEVLENVRHMGVIYCDGVYEQQGNQITYGSLIARGGFGTGGTPDVWYDERLRSGLPFAFNSEVSVARWEEIGIPGHS